MIDNNKKKRILEKLNLLYKDNANKVYKMIENLVEKHGVSKDKVGWINERDIMLITYGDSIIKNGEFPLITLKNFLDEYTNNALSAVHLLPMFPYTSDDGFSVVDYRKINPELGSWNEINDLASNYDLMFDAVINHISKSSDWFKGWLSGDERYRDYFIECDENLDYSQVTRPRALPLYHPYKTVDGTKNVWTTFSEDQVDINFENPKVLLEVLDILIMYSKNGARYIRFDAIGFAWKKLGTSCMHLEETHALVQLMRDVLDICVEGTIIITETNVPHKDNISYFGNGYNEAQMIYQFPLPPLTLFSFLTGDATKLSKWADSLKETPTTENTSYFNFLASHDGIGMRPTEGILTDEEKQVMVDATFAHGGKINFKSNPDGTKSPYELNINYQDALTHPDASDEERIARFMASQAILLSVIGVPGIYVHSLLGSRNWYKGVQESGINRRINREKLDYNVLVEEIISDTPRREILSKYTNLINVRKQHTAFSPKAYQDVLFLDKRVFSIIRKNNETNEKILVLVNVSNEDLEINTEFSGINIINNEVIEKSIKLDALEYKWIKIN